MTRKSLEWSFEGELRKIKKDLRGYRAYTATRASLVDDFTSAPYDIYVQCACRLLMRYSRYRVAAFGLAAANNWPLSGPLLHLYWRDAAFAWYVYLERCRQLAEETAARVPSEKPVKLRIAVIDFPFFTDIVKVMALAVVIGEDEIAKWFGERCLKLMTTVPPYCDPRSWQVGPVQGFLMQLYMRWRGYDIDVSQFNFPKLRPFQTILDAWDDAKAVEEATLTLAKIHAVKVLRGLADDNDLIFGLADGVGCILPWEILFLQRVRRDLGLSVPNPEHPLLRSPAVAIPLPCERSGYDDLLAELYAHCRKLQPDLRVPWEDEFQAVGPEDPKRVPVIDVDTFSKGGKKRSR